MLTIWRGGLGECWKLWGKPVSKWDPVDKTMYLWGTGQAICPWTTEHDAVEFTAAIVQHKDAALGGYWNLCSGANTFIDDFVEHGLMKILQDPGSTVKILVDLAAKGTAGKRTSLEDARV
jgi:hypothetical protein